MDKIILQTATLNCPAEEAFEMFIDNRNLESWLTMKADVEPKPGGKYELFWDSNDTENNCTVGCKILAIAKPRYLNFEWKGPKHFKHFMNEIRPLTNVTVIFTPNGNQTLVSLIHTGWHDTDDWDQARQFFITAWKEAFEKLAEYVNEK